MDARALDILCSTYWGPAGWKAGHSVSADDFAYAKAHGLMFDPVALVHDAVIDRAIAARERVSQREVADAFAASLGTRRLDHRSALGSHVAVKHLATHARTGAQAACDVCGCYSGDRPLKEDLNVLSFERLQWGGVRHLDPLYAAFDLEQFALADSVVSTPEQVGLLRALLEAIASAPPETTSATLQALLPKAIASNKAEREVLIGILGVCGILETPDHLGFLVDFVPWSRRAVPDRRFVDMAYPACWWTGAAGVKRPAVEALFGHLLG